MNPLDLLDPITKKVFELNAVLSVFVALCENEKVSESVKSVAKRYLPVKDQEACTLDFTPVTAQQDHTCRTAA
jgi:hypothetical protein